MLALDSMRRADTLAASEQRILGSQFYHNMIIYSSRCQYCGNSLRYTSYTSVLDWWSSRPMTLAQSLHTG